MSIAINHLNEGVQKVAHEGVPAVKLGQTPYRRDKNGITIGKNR